MKKTLSPTIISGPVKSLDCHPDVSEPTADYSASVNDFFEARRRLSSESEGIAKEAEIEQRHRKAVYWLISLAALISLLVGVLCLLEPMTPRTAGADQLDLAAKSGAQPRWKGTYADAGFSFV